MKKFNFIAIALLLLAVGFFSIATKHYFGVSSVPPGTIVATGRSTAPTGWLLCDGSEKSRTTYANLFDAIGTTYGVGDGSTTFNVPNYQDRVLIGKGTDSATDALNEFGGSYTISVANLPAHTHALNSTGNATVGNELSHTHSYTKVSCGSDTVTSDAMGISTCGTTSGTSGAGTSHTHTLGGTTESTGSGTAYYAKYRVSNVMIKY